jgi:hypothetical protein
MPRSSATTVDGYMAELPPERRAELETVRNVILKHLPDGYQEAMRWGMISYEIPLETYPHSANGQPVLYAALAANKRDHALHLMGAYAGGQREAIESAFEAAGLRLDMGKACVHFKTAADLPLDAIGKLIAAVPPARMIEAVEGSRRR